MSSVVASRQNRASGAQRTVTAVTVADMIPISLATLSGSTSVGLDVGRARLVLEVR